MDHLELVSCIAKSRRWRKKKRLFTVGAMDNLDHNSSFITAESSSHGTGISIIQFPTSDSDGDCRIGEA